MMPSSASSPAARIDHRTVYKNIQIEANNDNNDKIESKTFKKVFYTFRSEKKTSKPTDTNLSTHSTTPQNIFTTPRTYVQHRPTAGNFASKTKIPYPLATIWSKQTPNSFKRFSSLRMRGTKSNLPLIMEPTTNETPPTTNAATVNDKEFRETTTPNTAAVGLPISTRRKLALISQSDVNVAEPAAIKRSLSLRRNFKVPKDNASNNKTDISQNQICGATNLNTSPSHDVTTTKDPTDDFNDLTITTATATSSSTSPAPKADKQTSTATEVSKDFSNMSLNQNGVTTHSELAATTTTTSLATATLTQQSRPLTLTTSKPTSAAATSKGVKSPKTPSSAPISIANPHSHNQTASQLKTPPGTKLTPKTPPVTPDSPTTYLDDDLNSLLSYGTTTSGRSTMSCEHPYVARNGTTFSGRKNKFVVHCSNYAGQVGADYLTPTQRANRQVRRLKEMLCATRQDLEQRDTEILRLTREVVELRLFKASLSSPEERSASSDAVTVREAELKTSQDVSPIVDMVDDAPKTSSPRHISHNPSAMLHHQHLQQSSLQHQQHNMLHLSSDMQSSFADSGHFEDMTSSSVHSKDSSSYTTSMHTHDQACGSDVASCSPHASADSTLTAQQYEMQGQELIRLYEQRIEDLIRNQDAVTSEMKRTNCDRIEALLQKLAECNTRYADIVPDYENAKERIRELEKQLEELQRRLAEHEEKQKQMYLHMYQKGQEAERIARADQALELAHRAPQNKVSINELLHQLQSTQDELENIRAAECRKECGNNHALLTAKEAISLWVLGARKTIYRRLLEAQKNRTHVDPEVTLQFLKSAVYYFLTDKENSQGHLQAIESILEFSEAEKQIINKARSAK